MKSVVRTLNLSSIILELYVELDGGGDIMEQNCTLIHSPIDSVNSWKVSGGSLPQDACTSSLEDGAVFTRRRVYGLLENVGNSETKVAWQNVSIRSIHGKARCLHAQNEGVFIEAERIRFEEEIKDGITVNMMC